MPTPGQYFAGTANQFKVTSPIHNIPTESAAWIFHLECLPHGPMPPLGIAPMTPLGVLPMPPTLTWDPDRPSGTNFLRQSSVVAPLPQITSSPPPHDRASLL